jgi:hypothetical protein
LFFKVDAAKVTNLFHTSKYPCCFLTRSEAAAAAVASRKLYRYFGKQRPVPVISEALLILNQFQTLVAIEGKLSIGRDKGNAMG